MNPSTSPATSLLPDADGLPRRPEPPVWVEFARAPLVPVALAASVGLVADRYLPVPIELSLLVAAFGLISWVIALFRSPRTALLFLWLAFAGLAAIRHHTYRHSFAPDDIGEFAQAEPSLVRVRGLLTEDPVTRFAPKFDPLEPAHRPDRDSTVLGVTALSSRNGWVPASGAVRLSAQRSVTTTGGQPALAGLRAGDAVELVGRLTRPQSPGNPGEKDYADYLLDQRIRAELHVSDSAAAISRLDSGEFTGEGLLSRLRRHASSALHEHLPPQDAPVAVALLLGDGTAMDRTEWDAYVRTGVVHTLAISGQHLAILAGFLWFGLRAFGVRRTRGAWLVLAVVVGYTVLTGLRPSGVRSMMMVAAVCGALILRRPILPANAFALAWLVVLAANPTDPFTLGCQLSFLSVFVLVWFVGRWVRPQPLSPLEQLIDESRSVSIRFLRSVIRVVLAAYAITVVISVVNAPLLIANQNLVSPIGILIGPPIVLLTSVALVAGFLLMVFAPLGTPVALFALPTRLALAGCETVVTRADVVPGGAIYVPGVPMWWLVVFYLLVVGLVLLDSRWRIRFAVGLAVWVLMGLTLPPRFGPSDEMRVTVLSVGHGGCAVMETPDGRCLIYDAGTTVGPGVVRRVIAPFLWSRGIRRVDELFLSHADADHFNGIGELLRRFPIGQVTLTPSFAEKPTAEVAAALAALDRHHISRRIAVAGDRFAAGNVEFVALHPPADGPPGVENERSLVLHVRHAGHTILLTGDLEKSGTRYLLSQAPTHADVLMAPHHGSKGAFSKQLADWASPRLVAVSRGTGFGTPIRAGAAGPDVPIWDTVEAGAITIRSHQTGLIAESFRTGERLVVVRGSPGAIRP